jgi:hypothetical protein
MRRRRNGRLAPNWKNHGSDDPVAALSRNNVTFSREQRSQFAHGVLLLMNFGLTPRPIRGCPILFFPGIRRLSKLQFRVSFGAAAYTFHLTGKSR